MTAPKQLEAVEKARKLLNLASNNTNEAEAASARQRAAVILAPFGLKPEDVQRPSYLAQPSKAYKDRGDLWKGVAQRAGWVHQDPRDHGYKTPREDEGN